MDPVSPALRPSREPSVRERTGTPHAGGAAAARRLATLRVAYWRALLSSRSQLPRVLGEIRERVGSDEVQALADEAALALDRTDQHVTAVSGSRLSRRCEALAFRLPRVDPESKVADAIADELTTHSPECGWSRRVRGARDEYREARERFVRAHLPLVAYFARRWGRRGMPFRDRVQEGTIGLLHATDRFDPERGVQFSTYAVWWIRHAITRAHTEHEPVVHVPERMRTTAAKSNRGTMRLRAELGREPSEVELAAAVGVTPERLRVSIAAVQIRVIGLDVPVAAGTSITAHDLLVDEESVEGVTRLTDHHDVDLAVGALARLDTREREILRDRFGLDGESPSTFDHIAERLSLSRERVRQLQHRALAKLRHALEVEASVD